MPIAILIGFHCTGKTSLRRELNKIINGADYKFVDTDYEICREPHFDTTERIFLSLVNAHDCSPAINHIATKEKEFLRTFEFSEQPTLIATGPMMPLYEEEWQSFIARATTFDATIFHLTKRPELILHDLIRRQDSDARKIVNGIRADEHRNFGSWNCGPLNYYNQAEQRWLAYPEAEQLTRLKTIVAERDAIYARTADATIDMSENKDSMSMQSSLRQIVATLVRTKTLAEKTTRDEKTNRATPDESSTSQARKI